ncbi:DnaB-like helicase C-terminal domain-containing protein [Microscilla marina]|uniref:SF4 helicase domain-containing protein n=1 Tax=Microscilla marina ATCC 23134 TaxID=313606 RepID=A1ZVI7_MICM2|nr:DnaB-like helicase C-terminal domain-containing protein [Microscilla marina]EAY25685.1 hypothetical protein M23134_07336 [Microscilla marina ATCC 23134]
MMTADLFHLTEPLTHIASYPKAGKTSLAVSLALDALIHHHDMGIFFCSAGKERDIRHRMASAMSDIDLIEIEHIKESPEDAKYKKYNDTLMATFNLNFIACNIRGLAFEEFRRKCLYHAYYNQVKLIIVDDLHQVVGGDTQNNIQELKKLASVLNVPCIVFTPLPQAEDDNIQKVTKINALLNTYADVTMWLDRPEYEIAAQLEVIKQPTGEPSDIPLSFTPRTAHFTDVEMIGLHFILTELEKAG